MNRIFAAAWNQPRFFASGATQYAVRKIQVVVPSTLAVESEVNYPDLVGQNPNFPSFLAGIAKMRSAGGSIYCYGLGWGLDDWLIKFEAADPTNVTANSLILQYSWPTLALGQVTDGGAGDTLFAVRLYSEPPEIECWDFTLNTSGYSSGTGMPAAANFISMEFSPTNQSLYVCRQTRYIDKFAVTSAAVMFKPPSTNGLRHVHLRSEPRGWYPERECHCLARVVVSPAHVVRP